MKDAKTDKTARAKACRMVLLSRSGYLCSLPFAFTAVMANLHLILGLIYTPNKLYTALNLAAAAVCIIWALWLAVRQWRRDKTSRLVLLRIVPVLAFFAVCYGIAFASFGFDDKIVDQAKNFLLFGPTALIIGVLISTGRRETDFFDAAERFSLAVIPVALSYCVMSLTNTNTFIHDGVGFIDYMTLAYAYLPFVFVLAVQAARGHAAFGGLISIRFANALRIALLLLYWFTVLCSATRGAILCVFAFFVVLIVYQLIARHKVRTVLLLFAAVVVSFAFFTYAYTPPGMERLSRMADFTESLAEGQVVTWEDDPAVAEAANAVSQTPAAETSPNAHAETATETPTQTPAETSVLVLPDDTAAQETPPLIIGQTVNDRMTIYRLAWNEALAQPLTGMKPFGFTMKYGSYPHNFVLELICELGFPIGGLAVLFIAYCFIRLAVRIKKDYDMALMLVFLCGFVAAILISGTVWARIPIMFGIGYSLGYSPRRHSLNTTIPESEVSAE